MAYSALPVSGVAGARAASSEGARAGGLPSGTSERGVAFAGWYHDVGQLLLHVSNLGFFGDFGGDLLAPSAEWPAGSNHEYLFCAGLWVGAVTGSEDDPDTLVSAAVYQMEYLPDLEDPLATIRESYEGGAGAGRFVDDDGDCKDHVFHEDDPFKWYDEDPLDGLDNDGDGLIDEDFAAPSQQMYRTEYSDMDETKINDMNAGWNAGDEHTSLGLKVVQESYQWTGELTDDFVGIDFEVINMGEDTLRMVYAGFMVDADVGPDNPRLLSYEDDLGGFIDTVVVSLNPNDPSIRDTLEMTLAYMYDSQFGRDKDVVKGYIGCMFLGHPTVSGDTLTPGNLPSAPTEVRPHAFRIWSYTSGDPRNDRERYRFLRGRDPDGQGGPYSADFPLYDGVDNDNDGSVDENSEWRVNIGRDATRYADNRFVLSAGPWREFAPGETLEFQYAFVLGKGLGGMLQNAATVQQVYNGTYWEATNCIGAPETTFVHWVAETPPPHPAQEITAGDGFVRLEWDDSPEHAEDPLTKMLDFYGYQVWKAVGWTRESSEPRDQDWELILDIDRSDGGAELEEWDTGLEGIGKYCIVDTMVRNGFAYWYAVTAYDSTADGYSHGKYTQNKQLVFPHSGVEGTLDEVVVVPNPYVQHEYMARWNLEPDPTDPTGEKVCFQNLPRDSVVRIYSLGGELVETLYPEAELTGGDACWNLVSRNNQVVVSGVYLYHVESPVGESIGKFVLIK